MDRRIPPSEWVSELQSFTRRNASRLTVLETGYPEIGSQEQEYDYPLRGVAYDPRDRRVEIMLGDLGRTSPHLTHTIGGVISLELLVGENGRDEVLSIAHEAGRTLLRFARD